MDSILGSHSRIDPRADSINMLRVSRNFVNLDAQSKRKIRYSRNDADCEGDTIVRGVFVCYIVTVVHTLASFRLEQEDDHA